LPATEPDPRLIRFFGLFTYLEKADFLLWVKDPGKDIHIRSARVKPKNASVAVKYQGSWFYIEETDQATKEGFQLVKGLWHVGIANAASQFQPAPILTVPVSR